MGPQYYLDMAKSHGYGNPAKETLWKHCPAEERLKILRHLVTYRVVTETCQFEDAFRCPADQEAAMLDKKLQEWSLLEFGDMPMTLEPFIFFACWGDGFSLEFLTRNARRFLWLPEPLPNDRLQRATHGSFFDDDD